jgi:hypothetical protein
MTLVVLRYCVTYVGGLLPILRDNISVPSLKVKQSKKVCFDCLILDYSTCTFFLKSR